MTVESVGTPALAVGERFSAAMPAGDFAGIESLLAPDVVLTSPIRFEGRDDGANVFRQVRGLIEDLVYAPHGAARRLARRRPAIRS